MSNVIQLPVPDNHGVLQLRLELAWVTPVVWRRVVVPARISLIRLHQVIQAAMGWSDCHLHEFAIADRRYGSADPDWNPDLIPEQRKVLAKVLRGSQAFDYVYDFGDDWLHRIAVEAALPADDWPQLPYCIDGANACPPEDVGGPPGYAAFLEALGDPRHPEHASMREWHGGGFDPAAFERAAINRRLARLKV